MFYCSPPRYRCTEKRVTPTLRKNLKKFFDVESAKKTSFEPAVSHVAWRCRKGNSLALHRRIGEGKVAVEGAHPFCPEIRNTLRDDDGNEVKLKPGVEVERTIEADQGVFCSTPGGDPGRSPMSAKLLPKAVFSAIPR